ncbi:DUF4252 domain-containing protein [Tenacibaculum agarivorans]|uniref:DUF4252 domain-containing protein n=1 Tax=Tenacibaculum agarivorans TaxID=1908389 RepID=UPI00094BBBB3|nr:DUF4252 domain-containing protein [Tenacibaculum agarivorans]
MRRLITIITICFTLISINAQKAAYIDFYKAHKEDAKFSMSVPVSLANFLADEGDSEELDILLKKAKHCKVMVFNNEDNEVSSDFKKFVKSRKLKTLIRVKEGKNRAAVYFVEKKDLIQEIIIKAKGDEEGLVMVGLKVTLTKDELASIMSELKTKQASR